MKEPSFRAYADLAMRDGTMVGLTSRIEGTTAPERQIIASWCPGHPGPSV